MAFWAILVFRIFVCCFRILHFPVFENFSFWSHVANSRFLRIFRSGWIGHNDFLHFREILVLVGVCSVKAP